MTSCTVPLLCKCCFAYQPNQTKPNQTKLNQTKQSKDYEFHVDSCSRICEVCCEFFNGFRRREHFDDCGTHRNLSTTTMRDVCDRRSICRGNQERCGDRGNAYAASAVAIFDDAVVQRASWGCDLSGAFCQTRLSGPNSYQLADVFLALLCILYVYSGWSCVPCWLRCSQEGSEGFFAYLQRACQVVKTSESLTTTQILSNGIAPALYIGYKFKKVRSSEQADIELNPGPDVIDSSQLQTYKWLSVALHHLDVKAWLAQRASAGGETETVFQMYVSASFLAAAYIKFEEFALIKSASDTTTHMATAFKASYGGVFREKYLLWLYLEDLPTVLPSDKPYARKFAREISNALRTREVAEDVSEQFSILDMPIIHEPVTQLGKHLCTVCNYIVVTEGHEDRCRVTFDSNTTVSALQWMGDAQHALDLKIVLSHFSVPKAERTVCFTQYASAAAQTLYLSANTNDATANVVDRVNSNKFEELYTGEFRSAYLRWLIPDVASRYKVTTTLEPDVLRVRYPTPEYTELYALVDKFR